MGQDRAATIALLDATSLSRKDSVFYHVTMFPMRGFPLGRYSCLDSLKQNSMLTFGLRFGVTFERAIFWLFDKLSENTEAAGPGMPVIVDFHMQCCSTSAPAAWTGSSGCKLYLARCLVDYGTHPVPSRRTRVARTPDAMKPILI